ncbi:hypothetical protein GWK47_011625 [Chionoecetes opilio]|uniref:Uncharacterized protein n=1 Tax=Chionoecetes opilio TaxID=41210 RepID=A0A8J4XXC1_CHIOP|nr:hypothetical protein GWK47_011625 [Chionoecetes opilio]
MLNAVKSRLLFEITELTVLDTSEGSNPNENEDEDFLKESEDKNRISYCDDPGSSQRNHLNRRLITTTTPLTLFPSFFPPPSGNMLRLPIRNHIGSRSLDTLPQASLNTDSEDSNTPEAGRYLGVLLTTLVPHRDKYTIENDIACDSMTSSRQARDWKEVARGPEDVRRLEHLLPSRVPETEWGKRGRPGYS